MLGSNEKKKPYQSFNLSILMDRSGREFNGQHMATSPYLVIHHCQLALKIYFSVQDFLRLSSAVMKPDPGPGYLRPRTGFKLKNLEK